MNVVTVSGARDELADLIETLRSGPVEIRRHGKAVAVMLSRQQHKRLEEAYEELEDIRAYDEMTADTSPLIPWEDVKRDLGLE
jgi:PHD/YefM family antitoxin component YafN of YafNO toxin-antitoxin module